MICCATLEHTYILDRGNAIPKRVKNILDIKMICEPQYIKRSTVYYCIQISWGGKMCLEGLWEWYDNIEKLGRYCLRVIAPSPLGFSFSWRVCLSGITPYRGWEDTKNLWVGSTPLLSHDNGSIPRVRLTYIWIPGLPAPSCVTLDTLLNASVQWYCHQTENAGLREGFTVSVSCAWLRVGMQETVTIVIFMTVVARGDEVVRNQQLRAL